MDPYTPSSANPNVPVPENLPDTEPSDPNPAAPSAGGDPSDAAESSGQHRDVLPGPTPTGDWPSDPSASS